MLKVGKKNLFLIDGHGSQNEVYPLCVLDFYVHESRQRSGCGKILYEHMLAEQKTSPKLMAIDRPSPKLLAFLRKHYGLAKAITQVNHYVIFEGFFTGRPFECSPGPKRARIYMGKLQYV
jgi:alpha-tubulin N-acetyltransferase 1